MPAWIAAIVKVLAEVFIEQIMRRPPPEQEVDPGNLGDGFNRRLFDRVRQAKRDRAEARRSDATDEGRDGDSERPSK